MRELNLRTGSPVWLSYKSTDLPKRSLERDLATDILIVGMGISGAMTADLLTQSGHKVAMIDRRGPAQGSTPATTALVQYEIDVPLIELSRKIGRGKAVQAWRRARLAVQNLRDRIDELQIDCHMAARSTLFLAGNVLSGRALSDEAEARASAGLSARYLTASQLADGFGIDRAGAILSFGNLALDPMKLTNGLLLAAQDRGAELYAPEEAIEVKNARSGPIVKLRSGRTITAKTVILATGYELLDPGQDKRHRVISTWAIATKSQISKLWPGQALIWEASDPYLYLRTTHDGRVICGGEDEDFQDEAHRDALLEQKAETISAKLGKLLPSIDPTPEFSWAGSFGNTSTGLPLIGPIARKPNLIALMGYGGNGITFSRIAAEMIHSRLNGGKDADAEIFRL